MCQWSLSIYYVRKIASHFKVFAFLETSVSEVHERAPVVRVRPGNAAELRRCHAEAAARQHLGADFLRCGTTPCFHRACNVSAGVGGCLTTVFVFQGVCEEKFSQHSKKFR